MVEAEVVEVTEVKKPEELIVAVCNGLEDDAVGEATEVVTGVTTEMKLEDVVGIETTEEGVATGTLPVDEVVDEAESEGVVLETCVFPPELEDDGWVVDPDDTLDDTKTTGISRVTVGELLTLMTE